MCIFQVAASSSGGNQQCEQIASCSSSEVDGKEIEMPMIAKRAKNSLGNLVVVNPHSNVVHHVSKSNDAYRKCGWLFAMKSNQQNIDEIDLKGVVICPRCYNRIAVCII